MFGKKFHVRKIHLLIVISLAPASLFSWAAISAWPTTSGQELVAYMPYIVQGQPGLALSPSFKDNRGLH